MLVSGTVEAHEINDKGRTVIKLLGTPKTYVCVTIGASRWENREV